MATKEAVLDFPVDLTRQRERNEDAQAHKLRREAELDDVAWLMSEKRGRRFMYRLLDMAAVHRSPFTGNSQTFFNTGRQIIGTTLLTDIVDAGLEEQEFKMKIEHRQRMEKEQND